MNNKFGYAAFILALVALAAVLFRPAPMAGSAEQGKKETAFERVMRTRTLRCAYVTRARHFVKDPATKTVSGIDYEVMEAAGKTLRLAIDWQAEVGYGAFPEALNSGKQDAFCALIWTSAARAERVISSTPVLYTPLYVYAREGDTRFDNNLEAINDPNVTIALIEGGTQKAIADTSFPKARQYALPGDSDDSHPTLAVATGKADVLVADETTTSDYNVHNPDKKLRRVLSAAPVRTYPETFSLAMSEWELRELLNAAIGELFNNGTIKRILDKYEPVPGAIFSPAVPYADSKRESDGK